MSSPARLLPLCLGLAAGASAAWVLRPLISLPPPATATAAASPAAPATPAASRTPSLILTARLVGPDADTALDAYLALPPLAAKASRDEIAERSGRQQDAEDAGGLETLRREGYM